MAKLSLFLPGFLPLVRQVVFQFRQVPPGLPQSPRVRLPLPPVLMPCPLLLQLRVELVVLPGELRHLASLRVRLPPGIIPLPHHNVKVLGARPRSSSASTANHILGRPPQLRFELRHLAPQVLHLAAGIAVAAPGRRPVAGPLQVGPQTANGCLEGVRGGFLDVGEWERVMHAIIFDLVCEYEVSLVVGLGRGCGRGRLPRLAAAQHLKVAVGQEVHEYALARLWGIQMTTVNDDGFMTGAMCASYLESCA